MVTCTSPAPGTRQAESSAEQASEKLLPGRLSPGCISEPTCSPAGFSPGLSGCRVTPHRGLLQWKWTSLKPNLIFIFPWPAWETSGEKERSQGGNTPGVGSSVRNMRKKRERVREGPRDGWYKWAISGKLGPQVGPSWCSHTTHCPSLIHILLATDFQLLTYGQVEHLLPTWTGCHNFTSCLTVTPTCPCTYHSGAGKERWRGRWKSINRKQPTASVILWHSQPRTYKWLPIANCNNSYHSCQMLKE